jgi:hypothetical protein
MAREEEVILKVSADTSNLDRSIEAAEDAVKDLGTTGQTVVGGLDRLTGGLASKFVGAAKGVGTFIKGLNLTKVAIAGTGIGLLVLALGSIVTYFTQSFEGARKLKTALAGVGAAVDVVVDRVSKFGESVVKFFSGDREGAVKAFSEATADLGDELEREIRLAKELETRRQALTDAQREQLVTTAKERSEIKALNLIAEDTTKNINDRIAAADEAGAKERALFEQRKANAEEELAIVMAQNELADSGEEDKQRQAELEAEIFNLAAESLELQTTLQNKLNTLKLEAINLTRQQLQAEIDLANKTVEGMQKRQEEEVKTLTVTQETAEATLQTRTTSFADQVLGSETTEEAIRRQRRETFEDFKNNAELAANQGLQFAAITLDLIGSLNTIFTRDEEKRAKRSFEIGKKLAIVQAVMNTAEGVTAALTDKTQPSTLLRLLQTAAVAAAGVAQIATIKRQQFNAGGSASIPSVSQTGGGATSAVPESPQLDLGFLGAGAGQTGFRSYVIASEVSNSQQANQRINDQASLVG